MEIRFYACCYYHEILVLLYKSSLIQTGLCALECRIPLKQKMMKRLAVFLFLTVLGLPGHAQEIIRNLGFEQIDPKGQVLIWTPVNTKQQYQIGLDTSISRTGKASFLVESISNAGANLGVGGVENIIFSPLFKTEKTVKVAGYIKTENITDGFAGIVVRLNGKKIAVAQADTGPNSKAGTNDWSLIEVELPLSPDIASISFSVQSAGKGKAWFDDIQISVDDKIIASSTYEDEANIHN